MVCTGDYGVAGYTSWKASKGSTAAWSMTEMFVLFKDVPRICGGVQIHARNTLILALYAWCSA